jgi:hypothetical protein
LYVDGEKKKETILSYPGFSKIDFADFGTNANYNPNSMKNELLSSFCGQCGSIVFFEKFLSEKEVKSKIFPK